MGVRHFRWIVGVSSALALALAAEAAHATNGSRPISSGTRAAGRGGADTAVADDATALNTNPAGIAFIDGQRFDSSSALFVPSIRWRNPTEDTTSGRPSIGGVFGGSLGVCFDFEEPWKLGEALSFAGETYSETPSRVTPDYAGSGLKFGIGLFPLSGSFIDFDTRSPFYSDSPMDWEADIKEVALAVGVAWRPVDWLSIGLAPMFCYSQFENDQPVTQPKDVLQGHPFGTSGVTYSNLGPFLGVDHIEGFGDMDDASTFGFRLRLGVFAIPLAWESGMVTLGLSYASQTFKQDYLGTVNIDFTRQIDTLDPSGTLLKPIIRANVLQNTGRDIPEDEQVYAGKYNLRLHGLNMPQEVSLGAAAQFLLGDVGFLFAADVTYINWSSTFKTLKGRLTNGECAELNELTGDASPDTHIEIPLDWDDQIVLACGLAISPVEGLVLRAGYNYGRNPVPAETLQPTTPAILEHHVTLGASVIVRRVEISLAYEHDLENTVRIGRNRANIDVEQSEITASLDAFALGVSIRF